MTAATPTLDLLDAKTAQTSLVTAVQGIAAVLPAHDPQAPFMVETFKDSAARAASPNSVSTLWAAHSRLAVAEPLATDALTQWEQFWAGPLKARRV